MYEQRELISLECAKLCFTCILEDDKTIPQTILVLAFDFIVIDTNVIVQKRPKTGDIFCRIFSDSTFFNKIISLSLLSSFNCSKTIRKMLFMFP